MAATRTILIAGVLGKQGRTVARSLLAKGQEVRVLTRPAERAEDLAGTGAQVISGDPWDEVLLLETARGADGVFMVGTPLEKGVPEEAEPGKRVIRACRERGVSHLVFSSTCRVNRETGIPHVDSKLDVEAFIRETGQPSTILRPAFFMENFESSRLLPSILEGVLSLPLSPDRAIQLIALSDVGEFAAQAFLRPAEFLGQEIDLASDALTMVEVAAMLTVALNGSVRYIRMPDESAELEVGHGMTLMYRWFERHGTDIDIGALRTRYGIPLTSFAEYLAGADFVRRNAA
jgi:uncharacterized protein YbjT (DUF2867 family)